MWLCPRRKDVCEACHARARRRALLRRFPKTAYQALLEEHFPQYADDPTVTAFLDQETFDQWLEQKGII
jgi:hypothetical protein